MRIVSLVPSWTETLVEAGADVVGRTRFCVHPAGRVAAIPVVGGTKRVDPRRIAALAPDLVVLDREENTRRLAERLAAPWLATHVRSLDDVGRELDGLADRLEAPAAGRLRGWAARWRRRAAAPAAPGRPPGELPGVVEWLVRPGAAHDRVVYLIWDRPLMAIGPGTFIASVLDHLGCRRAPLPRAGPYPEVELDALDPARTVLLFSTEPYPFGRERGRLAACGFAAALVDGEAYGWFGVRALRFLESAAAG